MLGVYTVVHYVLSFADDLNLAYHSVLPLEVHGANYGAMRLLTKQCLTPQMVKILIKYIQAVVHTHSNS